MGGLNPDLPPPSRVTDYSFSLEYSIGVPLAPVPEKVLLPLLDSAIEEALGLHVSSGQSFPAEGHLFLCETQKDPAGTIGQGKIGGAKEGGGVH